MEGSETCRRFPVGLGLGLKKWPDVGASYRKTIPTRIARVCSGDWERRAVNLENEYLYHWNWKRENWGKLSESAIILGSDAGKGG